MTRKLGLAALASALMVLAIVPSNAGGNATGTYIAAPGLSYRPLDQVPAGIGYAFQTPTKLLTIDIDDINGNGVAVNVCQENDSNPPDDLPNVCGGEGDDVDISFCTSGNPRNVGAQNFKPNSDIAVFVFTQGPALGCSQVGVAGTITYTW
jgi:hypothetical protein